jgi:hypothetical protein
MLTLILAAAIAAPPSSTLTNSAGATLAWTVASSPSGVTIDGRSPRWTVHHEAFADLSPKRTVRSDAAGRRVTVDYAPDHVVVHLPEGDVTHTIANVWDGDTLDIRLGQLVVLGRPDVSFQAVDPATGDVYGFTAQRAGTETCGGAPCTHVHVNMTGIYRLVGPTFDYWYASDGRLVQFQGPPGKFVAKGAL